jgi:hypothetical protein
VGLTPAGETVAGEDALGAGVEIDGADEPLAVAFAVKDDAFAIGDPLLAGGAMGVFDVEILDEDAFVAGGAIADADFTVLPVDGGGGVEKQPLAVGTFGAGVVVGVDGVALLVGNDGVDIDAGAPGGEGVVLGVGEEWDGQD